MYRSEWLKRSCAVVALLAMMQPVVATAAQPPALTLATSTETVGGQIARIPADQTKLTLKAKIAALRQKVKYVFVLFQENRSFDHYFGTYPGANGLYSTYAGAPESAAPAVSTSSYTQTIMNTDGTFGTITPFLAPRTIKDTNAATVQLYPEDIYSVDHSHTGMVNDMHVDAVTKSVARNDAYALDQEGLGYSGDASTVASVVSLSTHTAPTSNPSLSAKQKGEVVLAHVDCDTIPFLWQWADRFTLFDNLHQTVIGPSTPNAIALISAQTGATQWALHPTTTGLNTATQTVPNETDSAPFPGSAADDYAGKPPFGPDEAGFATCAKAGTVAGTFDNTLCTAPLTTDPTYASYTTDAVVALKGNLTSYAAPQLPLTYASLPLSFAGPAIRSIVAQDAHPALDLSDVQQDIKTIQAKNPTVSWGWYQQGFGPEPFDGQAVVDTFPASTPHSSYIVHHNGPQYFGYLGDNPAELANMHGLSQFSTDVTNQALPANGGVFYVRGGYYNNDGLVTTDPSPAVRTTFSGNDDHGSYSDSQISEAMLADSINAIANSPYWSESAIIVTYDESDGFYDHAPEAIRSWGPDGQPMSGGPRIPTIIISPFSAAHTVSHVYGDHGSIVKFIDTVFNLKPLSDLPDEVKAKHAGAANPALNSPSGTPQTALGPDDDNTVGDMLEAFDNDRLLGNIAPLPASLAMISPAVVASLPHYAGGGCSALGITPTDYTSGYGTGKEIDPPPSDFNPRPTVSPGTPYLEQTLLGGVVTSPWTP